MPHVDEGRQAASLLRLGDDGQSQCGFTGRLRPVGFHHTTTGEAADAERLVDQNIARGNDDDIHFLVTDHAQDGPLAVVLLNLLDGEIQVPGTSLGDLVRGWLGGGFFGWGLGHKGVKCVFCSSEHLS